MSGKAGSSVYTGRAAGSGEPSIPEEDGRYSRRNRLHPDRLVPSMTATARQTGDQSNDDDAEMHGEEATEQQAAVRIQPERLSVRLNVLHPRVVDSGKHGQMLPG